MVKVALISITILLTGCSTYQEEFECPIGRGMPCTSHSKINKAITEGKVELDEEAEETRGNFSFGSEFKGNIGF